MGWAWLEAGISAPSRPNATCNDPILGSEASKMQAFFELREGPAARLIALPLFALYQTKFPPAKTTEHHGKLVLRSTLKCQQQTPAPFTSSIIYHHPSQHHANNHHYFCCFATAPIFSAFRLAPKGEVQNFKNLAASRLTFKESAAGRGV